MKPVIAFCLFAVIALPSGAQTDATPAVPVLQVEFDETETVPGQPLSLRLTVLAPTFLPNPPVWPSLEAPNLLVRLPGRATNPISARVGGETWAGITRNYRISPMVPGDFTIPPQQVIVTYADPDSNAPLKVTLQTDALAFRGVIPDGAEGLDPFIAADSLELAQTIDGEPGAMKPGDSVTRTVVATVTGTAPMFLPDLLAPVAIDGVAAYPDEPILSETDERGTFGGTRTESVTLLAESGGAGEAPPIRIDWYNMQTGEVETASADGFAISVDGPPARSAAPLDWRRIGLMGIAALVGLSILVWLLRRLAPPTGRLLRAYHAARLTSESHAYAELRHAIARRDNRALRPRLDDWANRIAGPDPRGDARLQRALTALGATRYRTAAPEDPSAAWQMLDQTLSEIRAERHLGITQDAGLPELNPTG